jgi:hypothetical protein
MKFGRNLYSNVAAMHKKTANNVRDTSGPVVSKIDNLSMWLFSMCDAFAWELKKVSEKLIS